MKIDEIQVVGRPLVRATAAEVDALAVRLWISFPAGYREYITRLGEGVMGGSFVRIYPPWRIETELSEWRGRINKYWFWEEGRKLLPKERAVECVIIGETINGDELIFHPVHPERLFVLPRDSGKVFEAGGDLMTAIEWMCSSGKLVKPFKERNFEPFDSRLDAADRETNGEVTDPEGESLDEIVELTRKWAKRHGVKAAARKDLRQQTPKGTKTELIYEGILIEGTSTLDVGFGLAWRIIDEKSGKVLGVFRWKQGEGHHGSAFEPARRG
jgi:hypothetical protein